MSALIFSLAATSPSAAADRQVALGISERSWADLDDSGQDALDTATTELGRIPAIWSMWSDWGNSANSAFPTALANNLKTRGVVPQIYWEPTDGDPNNCADWSLDALIRGDHDTYIRQWAKDAKAYGGTIILRFAHEMNGNWYIWGSGHCGNTATKFRQAWKHVWKIFKGTGGVGAKNVKFEYSIYGASKAAAFYPGTAYVDYLGLTVLNWGRNHGAPWKSMVTIMTPVVKALRALSKKKPIIAAEVASGPDQPCTGCSRSQWLTDGYPAAMAKWPQLAAIVYFDYDMRGVGQPDWRLHTQGDDETEDTTARDAYRTLVAQPAFQGIVH